MRDGENFYEIVDCGESEQRQRCFERLAELTDTEMTLTETRPQDFDHDDWKALREAIKSMREKLDAMEEMIDRAETEADEYDEETAEDRWHEFETAATSREGGAAKLKRETKGNGTMTKKQKIELRDNLIRCRRTYAERGAKLIEVTHLDGTKSGIANPKAVKAAMDALKVELDRQIEELGGDPERSGLNEVVRDWMLRVHPGERDWMEDFSETVTFLELARRMRDGENFYEIVDCGGCATARISTRLSTAESLSSASAALSALPS